MLWYPAPAKINMGLRVDPSDPNGFHPVDTVMHTVALSDQLYIEPRDHMLWESLSADVPMDDHNLVVRAYAWCQRHIGALPPVYVRLEKVIPVGAGLGGGSSDAASMVRWALGRNPDLRTDGLVRATAQLGMDVPFFVRGGASRAQGYGERLTPLASLPPLGVILANPGISLSTPLVYRAFDRIGPPDHPRSLECVVQTIARGQVPDGEALFNDLEEAAFQVMPSLRDFRDQLKTLAGTAPCVLSGSGPTYYILGRDGDWAEWMRRRLLSRGIPWVQPTTMLESW